MRTAAVRSDDDHPVAITEIEQRHLVPLSGPPSSGREEEHVVAHEPAPDLASGYAIEKSMSARQAPNSRDLHSIEVSQSPMFKVARAVRSPAP